MDLRSGQTLSGDGVANNRGRVMIFCAFKKGGLQFFQLSLRGGS